jgi:hypothetical protein
MFRKKKPIPADNGQPVMRGRSASGQAADAERKGAANPLARRFLADAEPATVDLAAPVRFQPAPGAIEDPKTAPLRESSPKTGPVITLDPETGKFYVHAGNEELPVLLQGGAVQTPTELRPGDTIRIGDFEFQFRAVP